MKKCVNYDIVCGWAQFKKKLYIKIKETGNGNGKEIASLLQRFVCGLCRCRCQCRYVCVCVCVACPDNIAESKIRAKCFWLTGQGERWREMTSGGEQKSIRKRARNEALPPGWHSLPRLKCPTHRSLINSMGRHSYAFRNLKSNLSTAPINKSLQFARTTSSIIFKLFAANKSAKKILNLNTQPAQRAEQRRQKLDNPCSRFLL